MRLTPIWKGARLWGRAGVTQGGLEGRERAVRAREHISCPGEEKRLQIPHLTAAEVLEEIGKTPDNVHVILAIFAGIAEEDLWPRPEPLPGERCGVRGGLRTLFI